MNAKHVLSLLEEQQTFLLPKLVMIDLEMTGVVPERDDILQIAMLKLRLDDNSYAVVGEPLEIFLHSGRNPENAFQREFLVDIFKACNQSSTTIQEARDQIAEWLAQDEYTVSTPVGDAIHQDMAFLYNKGLIDRGDIVDDKPVAGTFHYEMFDLNVLKLVSRQKTGVKESLELDKGIHNAMVDCKNQLVELNHYLQVLLS